MNIIAAQNGQRSHASHFYEPITVKGLLTYSAELLNIYLDGPLQPTAKKTGGQSIGTLYHLGQECYLGKINYGTGFFENDPNSQRTTTRKDLSVAAILEKIAYDVYKELGKGFFEVPASFLSLQVIQDDYHRVDKIPCALSNFGVESCLRILSKFPAREGYQDFSKAKTLSISGSPISFVDYVHAYHKPPETLLTPNGTPVPIKGLIELLAVMRAIADTDGLGGKAGNAGFVWLKNAQGNTAAAQTVKIDPGAAFTFKESDQQQKTNFVFNEGEATSGRWLKDLRDIQTANNDTRMNIHWQELSEDQREVFTSTLLNCLRYKNNTGVSDLLIHRQGKFRLQNSKTEKLPKAIGNELRTAFRDWLDLQEKIYAKDLRNFEVKHPDEILRIHYIDQWGECSLPMSEETFPVRELFTELVLDSKQEKQKDAIKAANPVSLPQLFDSDRLEPVRHVLLTGAAGVGKSTLCQKIAHDWASGHLYRERFQAIYWIPLRILNTVVSPEGSLHGIQNPNLFLAYIMAELVLNRPYLTEPLLQQFQANHKEVLLLFDGYDEASEELRALLSPLIQNPDLYLLLTSRPGPTQELEKNISRFVENLGFNKQHIETYCERFFSRDKQTPKSKLKKRTLLQTLETNPHLLQIAHTPLLLQMLCVLWEKGAEQSGFEYSFGELYQKMIVEIFCWQYRRQQAKPLPITENEQQQLFALLGDIALKGLSTDTLMIPQGVVLSLLKGSGINLQELLNTGLLKRHGTDSNTHYDFLHLTFQEYLTAYSMYRATAEQRQEFIIENLSKPSYKLVMIFLAGIVYRSDQSDNGDAIQAFFNSFCEGLSRTSKKARTDLIKLILLCLNECTDYQGCFPVLEQLWPDQPSLLNTRLHDLPLGVWLGREGLSHTLKILVNQKDSALLYQTDSQEQGVVHSAASNGCIEVLQLLYRQDPSLIQKIDIYGETAMHVAAENCQLETMKWLHHVDPSLIEKVNNNGESPAQVGMDMATRYCVLEAMLWLHKHDPSLIETVNSDGKTPRQVAMDEAAGIGRLEVMQWLHRQDTSLIQKTNDRGWTAMHSAAYGGQLEVMQWLQVQDSTLIQKTDDQGWTAMHSATYGGQLEVMQWLHGQNTTLIRKGNNNGYTAMHVASQLGWLKVMQWLHELAPELIQQGDDEGRTVMHSATQNGQLKSMWWLHRLDSNLIHRVTDDGATTMHCAALMGKLTVMQCIHELAPALIHKVTKNGWTAMHYAAQSNELLVMQWLHQQAPALIHKVTDNGWTAIHSATQGSELKANWLHRSEPYFYNEHAIITFWESVTLWTMQWLHQVDPVLIQEVDSNGWTIMHWAAKKCLMKIIQWLHEQNASLIQEITYDGDTVMHLAARSVEGNDDLKVLQWLHQLDPSLIQKVNNDSWTPMHCAAAAGKLKAMEWLHEQNPPLLQEVTYHGMSTMRAATQMGQLGAMHWLHAQNSNLIQKVDNDETTALHVAAQQGQLKAMVWLHEQDPSLIQKTTKSGSTPKDIAKQNRQWGAVAWLQETVPQKPNHLPQTLEHALPTETKCSVQ